MTVQEIDQTKIDAFAERMLGFLNGGSLTMMISIGHRTGLFDTMATLGPEQRARQIAEAGRARTSATCASGWGRW